jgi:Holliday junction resolvase-like predicted endonuclease
MEKVGIWQVTEQEPIRLKPSNIGLEKDLESWIERDPELLAQGLKIVGQQTHVEGGYLDLLGINPQGQWVVIELKSQGTDRHTLVQALDYAACIATLPWEALSEKLETYLQAHNRSVDELEEVYGTLNEDLDKTRDVRIYLVGTGTSPRLERMVDFLAGTYDVPITLVSYDVFQIGDGHKVLVRELSEPETTGRETRRSVAELCALVRQNGIGKDFEAILAAAREYGLYPRAYKQSIMYTPPSNHRRMLFTVRDWTRADNLLLLYFSAEAFAEFYPVREEELRNLFGEDGWRHMTHGDVEEFIANLDQLFERINEVESVAR